MKRITRFKNWLLKIYILVQTSIISIPRKNWVSYHARKLIKESQNKDRTSFLDRFSQAWFDLMHPTRWRASLILALSFVVLPQLLLGLLLNLILLPEQLINFLDKEFLSTVWQVLASIIGISFVIVVFLTEYSQDRAYERRAFPIYVSATSMIFTVMVGLLTLISMGVNFALLVSPIAKNVWVLGASAWNSLLFIFNLVLTLVLYIRTYQMLNPTYFRQVLIRFHRKKVLERVYRELLKRVKQNVSVKFIENLGVEASLLRIEFPRKVPIELKKNILETQVVLDLNLDLVQLASKNAKKLLKKFQKENFAYMGIPGRFISTDSPTIAAVTPELLQNQVVIPLQNAIRIIPWKSAKLDSDDEDLLINRDLVATAIASGHADDVESALDLYIETITAFLDSLKQLGYRFTPELAENERGWFNRWDIFETVRQHYDSLLRDALKSNHSEIINRFVSFPRRVMTVALEHQDHLAFRNFADLYPYIYYLANQHINDNRTLNHIADRCGRLLAEFTNYQLEHYLSRRELEEQEAKELMAYADHILAVFSQLAKYQIDNTDITHFRLTVGTMRHLLNNFTSKHDEFKLDEMEWQEKNIIDQAVRAEFVPKLEQERMLHKLIMNLQDTRGSALFGLGAWLCHLLDSGKITEDQFEKFSEPVGKEFGNLQYLNESYNDAITKEDRSRFHWSSWEMSEWPEDAYGESKFGSINFSSWLSLYYAFRALELTPENPNAVLDIKPTPNIKGNFDGLMANLKHILEKPTWEATIRKLGDVQLRSKILETSHDVAFQKQIEIEEIETIRTPLNQDKVNEFRNEMEKVWKEQGVLKNLFVQFGRFIDRSDVTPPKKLLLFGLSELLPKGVFLENPRVAYISVGDSYGRSLARSEDGIISGSFGKLRTVSAKPKDFDVVVSKHLALLQKKGFHPIILSGHGLFRQLRESKNYERKWDKTKTESTRLKNLDGFYKDIPILRPPINANWVVIYDPSKFGDLVQYRPYTDKTDFPFSVSIKEISPERAKELFQNNPNLAKDNDTDSVPNEEIALRKIQQHVELDIWQRFEVKKINSKAGFLIDFGDAEESG
jgi:hypothetical protein